jgi:hypothetical protein
MDENIITSEIAELAFRQNANCFHLIPDELKTQEMCTEAVKKGWGNIEFMPDHLKTKEICEIAMNCSVHAQIFVPHRFETEELYLLSVKADGMALKHVPDKFRTPEVCLQAVISTPEAKEFVPERFTGDYNIYEFFQGKLKNDFLLTGQLSFEQIQNVFHGEAVRLNDMYFFNAKLNDFTLEYDRKTNQINLKAVDDKPEKKQDSENITKLESHRKMKM